MSGDAGVTAASGQVTCAAMSLQAPLRSPAATACIQFVRAAPGVPLPAAAADCPRLAGLPGLPGALEEVEAVVAVPHALTHQTGMDHFRCVRIKRSSGVQRGMAMGSVCLWLFRPGRLSSHGSSSSSFAAAVGSIMLDQTCSSGATARSGMA